MPAHVPVPIEETLRVAIDASSLLESPTGVGTFVAEHLTRLAMRGDVVVTGYAFTARYLGELSRRLPDGVVGIRRPLPHRIIQPLWRRVDLPVIEWWTGSVDVVHGPNFTVPPTRRAAQLVTVHDLTALKWPELCDDYTVRFPNLIRRALARGAHVHTPSEFVAEEVCDAFHVERERVHAIHNGVSPPAGGDSGRGRDVAGGDRYVLAVGTIEPRKNLGVLVEAFDRLAEEDPDLRLVLAGGAGWRVDSFERTMAAAGHRERVVRLGRVSQETKADLLRGAAVLAYPSLYEGFGLPPLEAMSVGVPVVATSVGALPEVLGDAAQLVTPTAESIAEGLRSVLSDDARRRDLIRRGHERTTHFSWDRCSEALVKLYRSLATR